MLAVVSPLRSGSHNEEQIRDHGDMGNFSMLDEFTDSTLLDDINFDDLLVGFDDGDVLPDLEVDPAEILAEFSAGGEQEDSGTSSTGNTTTPVGVAPLLENNKALEGKGEGKELIYQGEEVVSEMRKPEENFIVASKSENTRQSASLENDRSRKSSASSASKGSQGKRKVKVDWTPELHRRFVQAVEQLGVDKAVPSRILELMGIDCLTRHNIASHLQKYRSHRKHLLAREAEAASWSQRRQMYSTSGAGVKREMNPWLAPTIGFPRPPAAPPMLQPFRPLHVWGHPTGVEPPLVHMWPRHIAPASPIPPWGPQPPMPPPTDPSYWHHHYPRGGREGWVAPPHGVSQGTPCFSQPLPRFPAPPVPGILPHPTMYRPVPPPMSKQTSSQLQLDALPSKESIDAAIGDVLDKPWLPLPLGLKPPSIDSVLGELQKQGVSKVPPSTS